MVRRTSKPKNKSQALRGEELEVAKTYLNELKSVAKAAHALNALLPEGMKVDLDRFDEGKRIPASIDKHPNRESFMHSSAISAWGDFQWPVLECAHRVINQFIKYPNIDEDARLSIIRNITTITDFADKYGVKTDLQEKKQNLISRSLYFAEHSFHIDGAPPPEAAYTYSDALERIEDGEPPTMRSVRRTTREGVATEKPPPVEHTDKLTQRLFNFDGPAR